MNNKMYYPNFILTNFLFDIVFFIDLETQNY